MWCVLALAGAGGRGADRRVGSNCSVGSAACGAGRLPVLQFGLRCAFVLSRHGVYTHLLTHKYLLNKSTTVHLVNVAGPLAVGHLCQFQLPRANVTSTAFGKIAPLSKILQRTSFCWFDLLAGA